MTKARGFGAWEEAWWDDERFDNGNNLSQLIYLRLWVQFTKSRVTKKTLTKYDHVYLQTRFRCTEAEINAALELLKAAGIFKITKTKNIFSLEIPGLGIILRRPDEFGIMDGKVGR